MAISQGPKSPGTITESGGSIVWNNPSNAATSDDVYAEANYVAGGIVGDFLDSTNFGFSQSSPQSLSDVLKIEGLA